MVTGIVTIVKEIPQKIYNSISGAITKVATWGTEVKNKAVEGMKNVITGITDVFKNIGSTFAGFGKNMVEGIWNGINGATQWIKDKISGWVGNVTDFLTFAQKTNVDTKNRIIAYDIRELGEQLMPLGMLVTLDSIFNRVIQNWKKGKTTWIFADEFYLLFRYQYSADFFYRLYKRIRKYQGFVTGLTQNVEELLKSDTARLMLANSEFLILLNQATTDRDELASLLNISENQLSYITNVGAGKGLIRCSGNLVPFENSFPKNTKLYRLMTTKPGEC